MPSLERRSRGPRLLLPSAVGLGLIIGIVLALVGSSSPAVSSDLGAVAGVTDPGVTDPVGTSLADPVVGGDVSEGQEAATGADVAGQGVGPGLTEPTDAPDSSVVVPEVTSLTGYQWPLPHARITLPFGPTPWGQWIVEGKKFHDGVDLATFCGDRIVAAHDGIVLAAGRHYDHVLGWLGDLGPYIRRLDREQLWGTLPIIVVVDDGNGYQSIYAHFSKIVVKPGQVVKAGEFIGSEGMTGHATGCHLHYGLFSPAETSAFPIEPDVAKRMKLPAAEIARVDPLVVLPARP